MLKPLRNHTSHMKFKETVEKLYVRDIYGGHFGLYVEYIYVPLNTFRYIFKILLPEDLEIR